MYKAVRYMIAITEKVTAGAIFVVLCVSGFVFMALEWLLKKVR